MKFSVRHILAAGLTVFMMTLTFVQPVFAAIDPLSDSCKGGSGSQLCTPQKPLFGAGGTWTNIINTMIFVIGSINPMSNIRSASSRITISISDKAITPLLVKSINLPGVATIISDLF